MADIRFSCATHRGAIRTENQDAVLCRPDLDIYAVADGAGGHENGRAAAERVIAGIGDIPADCSPPERLIQLRRRIGEAHEDLLDRGHAASTVAVLALNSSFFVGLWVGDSRIYLCRDGVLTQITHDHSLVQEMIDAGTLSPEQAVRHPSANIITRAVGGVRGDLQIAKRTGVSMPGDRFLLCSDGLTKSLSDDDICRLLESDGDVAAAMVDEALRRRVRDNVSVIVVSRD